MKRYKWHVAKSTFGYGFHFPLSFPTIVSNSYSPYLAHSCFPAPFISCRSFAPKWRTHHTLPTFPLPFPQWYLISPGPRAVPRP